jgi:hypothetical protein
MFNSVFDIGEAVTKFWDVNGPPLRESIRASEGLKCLYSGNISPTSAINLVKRTSLYVDTVVLPDPIYNLAVQIRSIKPDDSYYLNRLVKHVFNILKLRDALLTDSKFPMVVIAPLGLDHIDKQTGSKLMKEVDASTVEYAQKLFSYDFKTVPEILDSLNAVDSVSYLFRSIADKDQIPAAFRTEDGLEDFLQEFREVRKLFKSDIVPKGQTVGQDFFLYLNTQNMRTSEHALLCEELEAEPVYDVQNAWFFMNRHLGGPDLDGGIIQSLQKQPLNWIGNIPLEALSKLRENEELEYVRQTLRTNLRSLKVKSDTDLEKTVAQIQENLNSCFAKHNEELLRLQEKTNQLTKKDIPITIAAALIGWIPGIGNYLSAPFTLRDIKNQWKQRSEMKQTTDGKKVSFINFLMRAKDDPR